METLKPKPLTQYERKVLTEIAQPGSQDGLIQGAQMNAALERLRQSRHITGTDTPRITSTGRKALGLRPQRRNFNTLPRAQQAGMLCADAQFQAFTDAKTARTGEPATDTACAEFIRLNCGVNSRADLNTNPKAAERFDALRTEFDAWRGRIASPNR